ncbi:MAG: hypothetical protein LBO71_09510, partial [Prevotellaceae bacterium]|nr:hypothetical protein [Prevotellaceae bacterium]
MRNIYVASLCVCLLSACTLNLPDPIADMIKKGPAVEYHSYDVVSDSNGDSIVNKGETVCLRVWLKNAGAIAAKGVKATFSVNDTTYISGFSLKPQAQVSYGDIFISYKSWAAYDGSSFSSSYTFRFSVSSSTPVGTQIPISIGITDGSGNTWADTFSVTVEATKAKVAYGSHSVYYDNNGDKIINNGEMVTLRVYLKNIGTSTANGVKATFSTASTYVSGFTPAAPISYSSTPIPAGSSSYNYGEIQFSVSSTTPAGTQIPISISITDGSGNTWADTFSVTVEATKARIAYNSHSVYSDSNGDKIINNGEAVTLRVYLKNIGTSTANGVKATFSTASTYVSGFTPAAPISYSSISAGSSSIYGEIQFSVSSSTPAGTQIPISISITDGSGNTWAETFSVTVEATKARIAYNSHSVYSDSNGDKIINKGETVTLEVYLKNTGTSAAKGVKATFSTVSAY